MEITKFQSSEVSFHIRHDLRELPSQKNYGNESIDPDLTKNNYSLVKRGKTSAEVNRYRKELEKEIFHYNRKNLVHSCEAVIQCPADCPPEQKEAFFRESYNYFVSTLPMGERCVFVAQVHTDEKHFAPDGSMLSKDHLHIMYVPGVPDTKHDGYAYKLCADQLTKKAKLRALHPGLQKHLDECGIKATVYRKKNSDGKTIPLSVNQLKELTKRTGIKLDHPLSVEELSQIINSNILKEKQIEGFKNQLQKKEAELSSIQCELSTRQQIQMDSEKKFVSEKESIIDTAKELLRTKDSELKKEKEENKILKEKLAELQEAYEVKTKELSEANDKISSLEKNVEKSQDVEWGNSSGWGSTSGWGSDKNKDFTTEEEKTW